MAGSQTSSASSSHQVRPNDFEFRELPEVATVVEKEFHHTVGRDNLEVEYVRTLHVFFLLQRKQAMCNIQRDR